MYRCVICNREREKGEDVYFVTTPFSYNKIPHCSLKCAEKTKEKEIQKLETQLYLIKSREIEKERW